MAVRDPLRSNLVRKRIAVAFWIVLLCYLLLVARLVYLQGLQGTALRAEAIKSRTQTIILQAQKGAIYDRNEKTLATSVYAGIACFDPNNLRPRYADPARPTPKEREKARKQEAALQIALPKLAALLKIPVTQLSVQVEKARRDYDPEKKKGRFVPLKRDISLALAAEIRKKEFSELGFGVTDGYRREYSLGEDAFHVVGKVRMRTKEDEKRLEALPEIERRRQTQWIGEMGLERSFAPWLEERHGYLKAEVDRRQRAIPGTQVEGEPRRDGLDVYTTLDATIQEIAAETASKIEAQFHPKGISIVVMDPMNGDVLALVSSPTFNPNPSQRPKGATLPAAAQFERCASILYEPGSTIKPLTIAAALDAGVIRPDSYFHCSGTLAFKGGSISCPRHGGSSAHGSVNPLKIVEDSCNCGAAAVGLRMGPKQLIASQEKFGLFERLDVKLPAELRGRKTMARGENIYTQAKAARMAFGHAMVTTPLHLATAYCALANGGNLVQPRLVTAVKDEKGRVVEEWKPVTRRRVISPKTSELLKEMMRAVITDGTGRSAAVPGYTVAGKTGTARKYHRMANGQPAYVGSFAGFLPASPKATPRALILVAVDEPSGAYYGSEVAAPAFQEIARKVMAHLNVPEDDPEATQALAAARRRGTRSALLAARAEH